MIKIADSHCHLFYKGIFENITKKIENARKVDVFYMLTVSTSIENIEQNIEIANRYGDNIYASVGIHPDHSLDPFQDISRFLDRPKVVAIGEVGLDYHNNPDQKESQKKLFENMLSLSEKRSSLPYIIHARDCYPDILDIIMGSNKNLTGVFHCYTDSLENAKKILDMGFYLSFTGIITFKNAESLREVLRYIPLDRLLIETDAPYLAPQPHRGEINEPAYVRIVAERAAKEKGVTVEELADITTCNFKKLFKIKDSI
ncbi:MAG: TatD family hydrolase [Holosporales bacterium]|jgi:TatD DNase family protein|nr:TatD family hydrolase [Holosporales bacterium]